MPGHLVVSVRTKAVKRSLCHKGAFMLYLWKNKVVLQASQHRGVRLLEPR